MLKKQISLFAGILLLTSSAAFAMGWDKYEGVGKTEQKGVLAVAADWVKDKDDKYDVSLKFTNENAKTILIFVGDMKCARGKDASGRMDNHSDRRTLDLRPGESRSVIFTCRLATKDKGDYSVSLKVVDNPTGDANTPGKTLVENLTWKQGQTEGKKL